MQEIPLFPLKLVLFPGMPLTLHIFEDRYKKMVQYCTDQRVPFGVVLIKKGKEAHGPLSISYEVGTTAKIFKVEKLAQSRLNIVAVGQDRFKIINTYQTRDDFLMGRVEYTPLSEPTSGDLFFESVQLRPWLNSYIDLLQRANMLRGEISALPDDPQELGYLAAYLIQTPAKNKQNLLEAQTVAGLLTQTKEIYQKEVVLLKALMQAPPPKDGPEGMKN